MNARSPLVLLAEDNDDERDMYSAYLRLAGFQVVSVEDGLAALRLAHDVRPDVIVLDMVMPVLSGAETARRIRGYPALAQVPIVAISAYSYDVFRSVSSDVGCDAYVMKPCPPDELAALLRRVL